MPWLHQTNAKVDCKDKSVSLEHHGKLVVIHTTNPVYKHNVASDPLWDVIAQKTALLPQQPKPLALILNTAVVTPLPPKLVCLNLSLGPSKTVQSPKPLQHHIKEVKANLRKEQPAARPSPDILTFSTSKC